MRSGPKNIANTRIPGETGFEFAELSMYRRTMVISSPAVDQVVITVGCHSVPLSAAEAKHIAEEVLRVALEAAAPNPPQDEIDAELESYKNEDEHGR